jgi:uncharacterized protein with PIN domain
MGAMSSQFRRVEPASIERRMAARHGSALRQVTISRADARSYTAQLADLSKYGCRLAIKTKLNVGDCIAIHFAAGSAITATIVWNAEAMLGCRFNETLDAALFRQMTLTAN